MSSTRGQKPLVSVLTPSLNQARWLETNLQSVALQTYAPIEHIVMDGGSTDGSADVLSRRAGPGVRWRSEPDRGQSHALNKAFALSRGDVIAWLNADDAFCDRRTVAWVVEEFLAHEMTDVIYGCALIVDQWNVSRRVVVPPPFHLAALRAVNYLVQPSTFIRRRAIEGAEYFVREDLRYVMDRDLWFRLARHSQFRRLKHLLSIDREHPGRKVNESGYLNELRSFDVRIGVDPTVARRWLARAVRAYSRVSGLAVIARLDREIDPAFQLTIRPLGIRVREQLLLRRGDIV